MPLRILLLPMLALTLVSAVACTRHQVRVDPIRSEHVIEVKPMEMTINVNIRLVDKALDDFFGDIDEKRMEIAPSAGKTTGAGPENAPE